MLGKLLPLNCACKGNLSLLEICVFCFFQDTKTGSPLVVWIGGLGFQGLVLVRWMLLACPSPQRWTGGVGPAAERAGAHHPEAARAGGEDPTDAIYRSGEEKQPNSHHRSHPKWFIWGKYPSIHLFSGWCSIIHPDGAVTRQKKMEPGWGPCHCWNWLFRLVWAAK